MASCDENYSGNNYNAAPTTASTYTTQSQATPTSYSAPSIIKPKETQTNTLTSEPVVEDKPKEFKPIVEEPKPEVKPQPKPKVENIEDNPNALDVQDEFYDFESKKVARDTELVTMLVFDDVDAIVGVDEKVYGPFRPQDIVTLPLINAKIFFKNRKGRQVKI